MKQIVTIAKKELMTYLTQPVGYVFAGLLILVSNWIFVSDLFVNGQSTLDPLFSILVFLLAIFVPAITMGLVADEKKNGNWEVVLTLPVNEIQLIVGKFIGSWLFLLVTMSLLIPSVGLMLVIGNPDPGTLLGGLLGVILIGSAYLATGILGSCLSNSSIIAFLATTVFLLLNNFMGASVFLDRLPSLVKQTVGSLSLALKTRSMNMGLIDPADLVFFASWIAVSLILSVMVLKGRDK